VRRAYPFLQNVTGLCLHDLLICARPSQACSEVTLNSAALGESYYFRRMGFAHATIGTRTTVQDAETPRSTFCRHLALLG
jgi:hypothetical protein